MEICGICLHPVSDAERRYHLRITAEDIAAIGGRVHRKGGEKAPPLTPGVYACGQEMYDLFQPAITVRLRKTQLVSDSGHPVFRAVNGDIVYDSARGAPVMVLSDEQEAVANMLL